MLTEGQKLRGSQRWLQVAVNRCPEVLDRAIAAPVGIATDEVLKWVSPLEDDGFREYRDQAFLGRLGVTPKIRALGAFWPPRGPRWDALARTSGGRCVLVEAKANISEFNSDPSGAVPASLRRIQEAFAETRAFLKVRSETDWSRCFYQYANRIAHLYFLKEVNKVDAVLVFLYFVGDDNAPASSAGIPRMLGGGDIPGQRASGAAGLLPVASEERVRRVPRRRCPPPRHLALVLQRRIAQYGV